MARSPRRRQIRWRDVVVFVGPTLAAERARELAPATYAPPARMGDVYRAVRDGARVLGLVDGYYEKVPAVWHKEILWALSRGVGVYGASSMGALRAAEMHTFGMVGVGEVFRRYRDGELEDDDEVALFHAPAEAGYAAVSVPMVNIRATLRAAVAAGIVDPGVAERLTAAMKAVHYPDRSYDALLAGAPDAGLDPPARRRLAAWLPTGAVDVKRADAVQLLAAIVRLVEGRARQPDAADGAPSGQFESTWIWQELVGRSSLSPSRRTSRGVPSRREAP